MTLSAQQLRSIVTIADGPSSALTNAAINSQIAQLPRHSLVRKRSKPVRQSEQLGGNDVPGGQERWNAIRIWKSPIGPQFWIGCIIY